MTFNEKKSEYMLISNKNVANNVVTLTLNGIDLLCVRTHKHLGLVFNNLFNWSDHINYVCSKTSKRLGILYRFKNKLNRNTLHRLYC